MHQHSRAIDKNRKSLRNGRFHFQFGRFNSNKIIRNISFLLLAASVLICLDFTFRYFRFGFQLPLSLGDDSIIATIAPGRDIRNTFPSYFFRGLISSFRGEDHLFPLYYLVGIAVDFMFKDPDLGIKIISLLFHLSFLLISTWLVFLLWKNKWSTLLFVLFFQFQTNLNWRSMISLAGGVSPLLGMLVFYLLYLKLSDQKKENHGLTISIFLSSLLMSFGLETAFSNLFFLLGFIFYYQFWILEKPVKSKMRSLASYCLLFLVSFTPYLVLHAHLYAWPIPVPRNSSEPLSLGILLFRVNSYTHYTLPKLYHWRDASFFYLIFLLIPPVFYSLRCGSKLGKAIYFGFLCNLFAIVITGRSEHGLWLFGGTLLLMSYVDCCSAFGRKYLIEWFLQNPRNRTRYSFALKSICFLAISCMLHDCARRTDSLNFHSYPAYRLIGGEQRSFSRALAADTSVFSLFRLDSDVKYMPHIESFWLANQIRYGHSGLKLIPENFIYSSMGFITYTQPTPVICDELPNVRKARGIFENAPILVKDAAGYQSYDPGEGLVSRYVPIEFERTRRFQICIPKNNADSLLLEVERYPNRLEPTQLLFQGHTIELDYQGSNTAKVSIAIPNQIIKLELSSPERELKPKEIRLISNQQNLPFLPREKFSGLTLKTRSQPCRVDFSDAQGGSTTLMIPANTTIEYDHPSPVKVSELRFVSKLINLERPAHTKSFSYSLKQGRKPEERIYFPCEE